LGDDLYWLIMTAPYQEYGFHADFIRQRQKEIIAVKQAFPFQGVFCLDLPACRLDTLPLSLLVEKITTNLLALQPDIVYLPFWADIHSDHRIVFQAAQVCLKTFRFPSIRKVLMMETVSESELAVAPPGGNFNPNSYTDITAHIERKKEILKIYSQELQPAPFPRSLEIITAIATFRGAACGCLFAEAFMILKEIVK
jgi:N-acetylglucosamine malate deacetylase 1